MSVIDWAETGWVPDWTIRQGIRALLRRRRLSTAPDQPEAHAAEQAALRQLLAHGPLAVETEAANAQHYEVPAEFFTRILGPRLKYSCCWYDDSNRELAQAECAMLERTTERAEIADGMQILELGCGWGSLTLWLAEHFPHATITAVSNSHGQRRFIEQRCQVLGVENVRVITANMRDFDPEQRFDRVVSVEMFEHMRNHRLLLQRIAGWLHPDGKLFVHIFCHRDTTYLFETEGAANWMGRHFFTGGMMPSEHHLLFFADDMAIEQHWRVGGLHYWRTCEDWLTRLDQQRAEILALFTRDVGPIQARLVLQRWRIFLLACAELFRFHAGREWYVGHYRFHRTRPTS
jgi:cyclopropane-fatty-acyl-phospholipid synthase